MASRIDAAKEGYQRFRRGDLERATDAWSDDFVLEYHASGIPGSGRHEGKKAAIS